MMHRNPRFRSTGTTSDFIQNYMTDRNFKKINIKIAISTQQCTPLRNFSHFVERQIMGPNMPPKNMTDKKFEKINIKIEISCSNLPLYRTSDFGTKFAQKI